MKIAKASQQETQTLLRWLQARDNAKFENAKDRPPAFMRVVFGYETLVLNCCDPDKDTLEWRPGYAPADTDRYRVALERIRDMPVSERVISTVLSIVTEALKPPMT